MIVARARTISALEHIDPTDRDTWIRIGLAIHSASSGDEDGFQIWHAWSCGGLTEITPPTYVNENDCRYNWQSFNKYVNGKESVVTLGTLFALAKEGGYDPTPKPPDDSRFAPIDSYADADAPQDLTKEEWSEPTPKSDLKPKLLFVSFAEIVARNSEPEWLLYKILEKRVIGVLAGPRGSFKSFVALDWLMRSALQKQSCLMLSGEGGGLGRRIDAWMRTFAGNLDLGSLPVQGLERPINLNVDETYLDIMDKRKSRGVAR